MRISRESVPNRGNSKCQSPDVVMGLTVEEQQGNEYGWSEKVGGVGGIMGSLKGKELSLHWVLQAIVRTDLCPILRVTSGLSRTKFSCLPHSSLIQEPWVHLVGSVVQPQMETCSRAGKPKSTR